MNPSASDSPLRRVSIRGLLALAFLSLVGTASPAPTDEIPSIAPGGRCLYRVRHGDSLSAIAERFLGRARLWPRIAAANGIEDPQQLEIGHWIQIPFELEDTFGSNWFPQAYLGPFDLRIDLDLDGSGKEESISFEPILARAQYPDEEIELTAKIVRPGRSTLEFPVAKGWVELQLRWAAAWQVAPGETLMATEVWEEHGAAVASAHANLYFHHLDTQGEPTLLYTLEHSAGVQHHSAASGSSAESELRAIRRPEGMGFEVVTRGLTNSWEVEEDRVKIDESETRFELGYRREERKLELLDRKTESQTRWENRD